ncbi:MAG: 2-dehydropantoate 2-reductase [Pseudomonadota bacterium]|nr:2-dehydropantoate 2-reductase [Pseudomonadota bacterium]
MRICVYGAGAVGGFLGAKLALAGADVSLIARGAHLEAMRRDGLKLVSGGETTTVPVHVTDDPAELGPQDHVIVTMKAHSVPPVAASLAPLLAGGGTVTMAVNGVPWWYFHGIGGALEGRRIASVDPGDAQWTHIGPDNVLGCVVYVAADTPAPGVIGHGGGSRFLLGEPKGGTSPRIEALSAALTAAGLDAPVRPDIRQDVWTKLWGNLSFNPVSALTGATLAELGAHDGARAVIRAMMIEAQAIGETLGVAFPVSVDERLAGGAKVGAHKSSMLQDFEKGRPMEIGAILGAVQELGRVTGTDTPVIDMVLGLADLRDRTNTGRT